MECRDDNNCYIQHTLDTMNIIASQVDYWDNVSLLTAIVAGIAGIVATIMIALQGDANRYWDLADWDYRDLTGDGDHCTSGVIPLTGKYGQIHFGLHPTGNVE